MIITNKNDALNLIDQGMSEFRYQIKPYFFSRIQLYLTGKIANGIEIFGIGPNEIRALGFLFEYHKVINIAINAHYRIFVKKEGSFISKGNWFLEFIKL